MGIPTDVTTTSQSTGTQRAESSLFAWGMCCTLAAIVFLIYASSSLATGHGSLVLPLDDTYIHFQYARQMANGQPYVYNPGDPPTSGATSFLYPYVLAAGYLIGFQGLNLGLWALAIGALSLTASAWFVYRLARSQAAPNGLALLTAALFALNGPVSWHFMSGMETGLVMTFTLATLYMFSTGQNTGFLIAATLLALSRPEGSIMTLIAVGLLLVDRSQRQAWRRSRLLLVIPVFAVFAQPLINLLLTGSPSSTGTAAKSILGTVPFYWDAVIQRIAEDFLHMWGEFATGIHSAYTPIFIAPLAFIGWIRLVTKPKRRSLGLLLLAWFVVISAAISTLDTAFWHFRRYHMPLIALLYPLAAWGSIALIRAGRKYVLLDLHRLKVRFAAGFLLALIITITTLSIGIEFVRLYRVNINNVVTQPLAMTRWLDNNTPENAVIAVHDVGMMRYLGNHYTIDMVGLTTPGAADSWRNGPGAVAEFLMSHEPPPDYVAAYTSARGLNYLADTGLYGTELAAFPADYDPADNVALAAEFQGIYAVAPGNQSNVNPDALGWHIDTDSDLMSNVSDSVNVASIEDETQHQYTWENSERLPGFATEVYELQVYHCTPDARFDCRFRDGGRRINGEESFTMRAKPGEDAILSTIVHPVQHGTFDVYVGDTYIDTQWIPEIPGQWFYVNTLIPADVIMSDSLRITIKPHTQDGYYSPYHHFLLQGIDSLPVEDSPPGETTPTATYEDSHFMLSTGLTYTADAHQLEFTWKIESDGQATGDYKFFLHLYSDIHSEPIKQYDSYLIAPIGNWLPGVFSDTIVVDLSDIAPGIYPVAVGFYNPYTFERLMPESITQDATVDHDGQRLFIGEVVIVDHG